MLESYIVQIFIYIILIGLIHYLYLFFRNNLTNPKVIDLVNRPTTEYTKMYNTIKQRKQTKQTDEMKDELKDYFKNLNKKNETTSIDNLPNSKNIRNPQQTIHSIEKKKVTFDTRSSNHNRTSNNSRQQEIPSNNIELEYSSLNQNSGGISYSSF